MLCLYFFIFSFCVFFLCCVFKGIFLSRAWGCQMVNTFQQRWKEKWHRVVHYSLVLEEANREVKHGVSKNSKLTETGPMSLLVSLSVGLWVSSGKLRLVNSNQSKWGFGKHLVLSKVHTGWRNRIKNMFCRLLSRVDTGKRG